MWQGLTDHDNFCQGFWLLNIWVSPKCHRNVPEALVDRRDVCRPGA
ncbi:protein of unknown function [Pseudorhizobium banfieldiae]|uniref:Uncharacterized protein n=1 Tax=Pseudorhizobium banfieldiae TaxID=1125847 RepID=L0NNA4_9HYPH|nr:protein of unknown function [Pseudorhizobium banfieldiae]